MARHSQRESHTFARVPRVEVRRSQFDMSHTYKTTFDEGWLIPFFTEEVVPGDTFRVNCNFFARLATLKKPIMDNLYLETQFFFVPNRLLWDNWERVWGAQDNPGDSTDYQVPIVEGGPTGSAATGSLWDYLGVPVGVTDLWMNALYPRAYNRIWNEWYRDQQLQDSVPVVKGDSDAPTNYTLLKRGKRHDYFTSCLPWPQKGPEVFLPIGGAIVEGLQPGDAGYTDGAPHFQAVGAGSEPMRQWPNFQAQSANALYLGAGSGAAGTVAAWTDPQLKVSSTPSGATINDFRQAVVAQQFYEMIARGGSRYVELLQAVYGVSNGDARLQRPEYLGGGRTPIMVNPVVNTAGQSGQNFQADLAAYGVGSSGGGHGFTKSFTEHGILMGMLSVRADLNYQQGMPRRFSRRTKFDYLIPHFAHLGEQEVLNKEIYAQGGQVLDNGVKVDEKVFGYVGRYDEYRYHPSIVTGQFRSSVTTPATTLDFWHLAQDFEALPTLSPAFIEENPPVDRIVQVPSEPSFLLDSFIQCQATRELPVYSVPGLRRI